MGGTVRTMLIRMSIVQVSRIPLFFFIKYLYSVTIDPFTTYMYVYTSTGTCKLVISHITQVLRYGTVHTVVVLVIFILVVVVARACDVTSTTRLVIES